MWVGDWQELMLLFIFVKDFIYLFIRDRERGRDTGRGRSRLPAGSPMPDSIPGLQGQALGAKPLSHLGCPILAIL